MYYAPESGSSVSAFVTKLWQMVNDKRYDELISWCSDGSSFVIKDQNRFCAELLPKYYKHNNMASFIRQLNKYGFRKIVSVESASLKNDKGDLEFAHAHFIKDYPLLLDQIRRKVPRSKEIAEYKSDSTLVNKLLQEVQQLKTRQNIFESKLATMKNENDALWREHSLLRQKHQKQQQIVNKLIEFLVTLVQQSRSLNLKRRAIPLKLTDGTRLPIEGLAAIEDHSYPSISPVICEIDPYDIIMQKKNSTQQKKSSDTESIFVNGSGDRPLDVRKPDNNPLTMGPESLNFLEECPTSPGVAVPLQEVSPAIVLRPQSHTTIQDKLEGNFSNVRSMLKPSQRKKQQLRSGDRPLEVRKPDNNPLPMEPEPLNFLEECPASPRVAVPLQEVSPAVILRPQSHTTIQDKLEGYFSNVKSMLNPSQRKKQQLRSVVPLPVKNSKEVKCNIEQTSEHCIDSDTLLDANEIISLEDSFSHVDSTVTCGQASTKQRPTYSSSKETSKRGLKRICSDSLQKDMPGEVEETQKTAFQIVNNDDVQNDYNMGESYISLSDTKSDGSSSWNLSDISSLPVVFSPSGTDITPCASNDERRVPSKDTSLVLSDKSAHFREEMDSHIDLIQSDLDALKDILNGEGLSLDVSTILGLFSSDDPLSLNLPEVGRNMDNPAGNEIVSYTGPSLIDIVEGLEDEGDLKCPQGIVDQLPDLSTPQPDIIPHLSTPTPTSSKKFKK